MHHTYCGRFDPTGACGSHYGSWQECIRGKSNQSRTVFHRLFHNNTPDADPYNICLTPSVLPGKVLASSEKNSDGLLNVSCFDEASFDRILLDPPCSALGLRPKLHVDVSLSQLEAFATYQKRLLRTAVALLKPGGVLTYSTCTINTMENEMMVRHALDAHPELRLEGIDFPIGSPGLAGAGLDDPERHRVRRFDPAGDDDTTGFFLAKFRKVASETSA